MTEQQRPDLPTNEEDVEGHRRNFFRADAEPAETRAETDEGEDDVEGHRRHFFRADAEGAETSEGTPGQTS
jgi:hypothetical protein